MNWKTSISLNYNYALGNQQQLQQNQPITFYNKNFTVGANIIVKMSSKADAEYTVSYLSYASRSQLQKSASTITSANQSFAFNYFMTNKFALKSLTEHYYVQNNLSSAQHYYL